MGRKKRGGRKKTVGRLSAHEKYMDDLRNKQRESQRFIEANHAIVSNPQARISRHYLDVHYHQREEAKALGARWDAEARAWYYPLPDGKLLPSRLFEFE